MRCKLYLPNEIHKAKFLSHTSCVVQEQGVQSEPLLDFHLLRGLLGVVAFRYSFQTNLVPRSDSV